MLKLLHYPLVLGLITFLAALGLAGVEELTREPIAEALRQDFLKGLNTVLPVFDNEPDMDVVEVDGATVYVGRLSGEITGYAVNASSMKGYGGEIRVIVGVDARGNITGVEVLTHRETPGLGDKITTENFLNLFKGRSINETYRVKADGGDIDQFSGATISPRAVTEAVNKAVEILGGAL